MYGARRYRRPRSRIDRMMRLRWAAMLRHLRGQPPRGVWDTGLTFEGVKFYADGSVPSAAPLTELPIRSDT